jgi:hypothetical protein
MMLVRRLLLSCAALGAGCAMEPVPREVVRGPMPTRVLLPQALPFPEPRPRTVRGPAAGELGVGAVLSYGSIYEFAAVPPDEVYLDAEVAHAALLLRHGLDQDTDVEVELGTSFASSGFLDSLIDEYHALFGFPGGDRASRDRDQYALELAYGGQTVYSRAEDELLLMDLPVHVTRVLRRPDGGELGVALRFGIELPTGDEHRGTGSGGLDFDLGVLFERTSGRVTWTGGIDYVWLDAPDAYGDAGVEPNDLWLASLGFEFRWDHHTSLLASARYRSPFVGEFEIKEVDRPIVDLAVGVARDVGGGRWFVALHEDVQADSGPDVVVSVGYLVGL